MAKIKHITAREIIDSRSNPTIETAVVLESGHKGIASVPSGASIGKYEALELRDNDPNRYSGMGVTKAVTYVNKVIGPGLTGVDPTKQYEIDQWMKKVDGTETKQRFGANTILSISLAVAKAASASLNIEAYQYIAKLYGQIGGNTNMNRIPTPIFNVINGGKHGSGNLDFQEFHIIPATSKTFPDALRLGAELYNLVKKVLIEKNAVHSVGDEGGFAPDLYTNLDAFEVIMEAVRASNYRFGEDIFLGLDVAASEFRRKNRYYIRDQQGAMATDKFIEYYKNLNKQYHLLILEDPLAYDDWSGWKKLTQLFGDNIIIVGDDLLATNLGRLKKSIKEKACTGILAKPNQIGTLSEMLEVVKLAKDNKYKMIVSHRSGETTDDFIADIAVGVQSDYVKFGAPARGERVVKYNRLLQIASQFNQQ